MINHNDYVKEEYDKNNFKTDIISTFYQHNLNNLVNAKDLGLDDLTINNSIEQFTLQNKNLLQTPTQSNNFSKIMSNGKQQQKFLASSRKLFLYGIQDNLDEFQQMQQYSNNNSYNQNAIQPQQMQKLQNSNSNNINIMSNIKFEYSPYNEVQQDNNLPLGMLWDNNIEKQEDNLSNQFQQQQNQNNMMNYQTQLQKTPIKQNAQNQRSFQMFTPPNTQRNLQQKQNSSQKIQNYPQDLENYIDQYQGNENDYHQFYQSISDLNSIQQAKLLEQYQKQQMECQQQKQGILLTERIKKSQTNNEKQTKIKTEDENDSEFSKQNDNQNANRDSKEEDSYNRSIRGLRVLSLSVKDIVCNKKSSTYKEVAEILIQQLNKTQHLKEHSKDEQNVKRRVYDALNVLISADIIKKKGKNVISDQQSYLTGNTFKKSKVEELEELKKNIIQKENVIKFKIQTLKEMAYKYISLRALISRNKQNDSKLQLNIKKQNGAQQLKQQNSKINQKFQIKVEEERDDVKDKNQENSDEKIQFPFILFTIANNENYKLMFNPDKTIMKVNSRQKLNIFGDIDVLLKMKLYEKASQDQLDAWIPSEIQKYIQVRKQIHF